MNDQLEPLLALQGVDDAIQALETRLAALAPQLAQLEAERQGAERAAAGARQAVDREDERYRKLQERAEDFRRMNDRALGQMDQVRKGSHVAAASAQIDIARRALTEAEAELTSCGHHLAALRTAVTSAEERLYGLAESQAPLRERIESQRSEIERELQEVRAQRQAAARQVEPRLLSRYDRVRGRRKAHAVYALREFTCGSCDTAIPTQKRAMMAAGAIDVCESCGVLLYATVAEGAAH